MRNHGLSEERGHPTLWLFFEIPIMKLPSPSIKPVTHPGLRGGESLLGLSLKLFVLTFVIEKIS